MFRWLILIVASLAVSMGAILIAYRQQSLEMLPIEQSF